MKQRKYLTLFIIALILLYIQEAQSSLANTSSHTESTTQIKLTTKTATNSKTNTKSKLKTQLKSQSKSKSMSKTNTKTNSNLKAKANSNSKIFETDYVLDIPGFSSNIIGNILSSSEKEYEDEEANQKIRQANRYKDLPLNQDKETTPNNFNSNYNLNMLETNTNTNAYTNFNVNENSNSMLNNFKPYLKEAPLIYQNWFSVESKDFANNKKFPQVDTVDGEFKIDYEGRHKFKRLNPKYNIKGKISKTIPNIDQFYFRVSNEFLWYSFDSKDINIVGRLKIKKIYNLRYSEKTEKGKKFYCFKPYDTAKTNWKLCNRDIKITYKWFCILLKLTKLSKDDKCDPKKYMGKIGGGVLINTVTQPIIIIPTASHKCNVGWSYKKKGNDWECLCRDGLEQSPIDLPPKQQAIETNAHPVFEYRNVKVKMSSDYAEANLSTGDNNVIRYEKEALRIKHPNFGKIVTLDGAVYYAQEIVFHTPSEHTINGKQFDMEMQVIHYGKSVGDTLKSVILSFLFKAKPGSFNKFIDKLDFFDLPNPIIKAKELSKALFIPAILQDTNEEDYSFMLPFSFYTYQGSHTAPPCAEKTIHYVASKPINLSNTALEMFKESLRIPDQIDNKGNVHVSDRLPTNFRLTQPLNGRAIFHYDHNNDCPDFRKAKQGAPPTKGHYEKIVKQAVKYFHVNGVNPSGIPNAYVVTNKEALKGMGK